VLAALDDIGVRATFFVLGKALAQHRPLGREICAAGHELAVHGWDHRYLLGRTFRQVRDDLARTHDLVTQVTGGPPLWFRPAYGVLTGQAVLAARRCGLRPVLWTAWARDWTAMATPESIVSELALGLTDRATLLLHDADYTTAPGAWRHTVAALPRLADLARARGLTLGPLRDHELSAAGSAR
jgi:peptidoglycan/xylan/chitin deacetylase (PgdA/CDA1 family)